MKNPLKIAIVSILTLVACTTPDTNPSDEPKTMPGDKTHPDTAALMRLKVADSVQVSSSQLSTQTLNLNVAKTYAEPSKQDPLSTRETGKEMTRAEYFKTARFIWKTYVPKSGQAETVQGELLRAIEKLADEAQRNRNVNFHKDCHGILISFLRKHLVNKKIFDSATIKQIKQDLDTLLIEGEPYIEEDLYDRIRDRIVDWHLSHENLVPHTKNPKLLC